MRIVFSDLGRLQGILDFEAALARAEARAGVIPASAAEAIGRSCIATNFNFAELSAASADSGNSAIPVIHALRKRVESDDRPAAEFVHWGVTSQDAMDTGLVLQLRAALKLIDIDAHQLCFDLATLAAAHRQTPIAGRTWLQHAAPTTFGLKVAGWLCSIARHVNRLRDMVPLVLALQLGGAAGTLAALGERAEQVTEFLAEDLDLSLAEVPWHAHRDRLVEVGVNVGMLAGSLGKIATDIGLMAQSEVAEVAEPLAPGRGGSSTMPQKHNPVGCAAIRATAIRIPGLVSTLLAVMPQEHERALGGWQAEWETLPEIFLLASGALVQARQLIGGLQVYPARMQANLEATSGQIYAESVSTALAKEIGPAEARKCVEHACRIALAKGCHLRVWVLQDPQIAPHFSPPELAALFEPQQHTRAAARLVDRALAATAGVVSSSPAKEVPWPLQP